MTAIIGSLDTRKHGGSAAMLLSPIEYQFNDGRSLIIPKGFIYDGGSIPRIFWSIVPPFGTYADYSWLPHDMFYFAHRESLPGFEDVTREMADLYMLEVHHHVGVDEFVAHGSFAAVRGGAARAWMTPEERAEIDESNIGDEDDDWFLDQ
jgi:hypothetical protein